MIYKTDLCYLSGWWLTYPSEKYESIGIMKFPIYGKTCSKPPTSFYGKHGQSEIPCKKILAGERT